jgi:hypothetical protein
MKTMIVVLAMVAALAQAQPKPVIENERVVVWQGQSPPGALQYDTVAVSLQGKVTFAKAGSGAVKQKVVIGLKPLKVEPLANPTKYPLAMDRPGAMKLLENDRVIVWDYRWTPGKPTPMHFHNKDVVVTYLEDGDLKSTTDKGEVTTNQYKAGMIKFNLRNRTHTEELVKGTQRAIIVELK